MVTIFSKKAPSIHPETFRNSESIKKPPYSPQYWWTPEDLFIDSEAVKVTDATDVKEEQAEEDATTEEDTPAEEATDSNKVI